MDQQVTRQRKYFTFKNRCTLMYTHMNPSPDVMFGPCGLFATIIWQHWEILLKAFSHPYSSKCPLFNHSYKGVPIFTSFIWDSLPLPHFFGQTWSRLSYAFFAQKSYSLLGHNVTTATASFYRFCWNLQRMHRNGYNGLCTIFIFYSRNERNEFYSVWWKSCYLYWQIQVLNMYCEKL